MKKVLSLVLFTLVLCLSFSCVAVAGDAEFRASMKACIVTPGENTIIYKGETYYPVDLKNAFPDGDWDYADVEFEKSEDEDKYWFYDICVYEGCDFLLEIDYELRGSHAGTKYYAKQSHIEELTRFANGETPSGYKTTSNYGESLMLSSEDIYDHWINGGISEVMPSSQLDSYQEYSLYSTDASGCICIKIGEIFRMESLLEEESDTYFLVYYPEYDRTYFYADGSFAREDDVDVVIYKLNDYDLKTRLSNMYDTLPEDDLNWLVDEEVSDAILGVVSLILFGIFPAAVIAVALIFILRKVHRPYRDCLIALAVCCAVIIICYITVFILLT